MHVFSGLDDPKMTIAEAADFIRDAVGGGPGGAWADIGAGSGTFTEALASLLEPSSTLIAMDNDAAAIGKLNRVATRWSDGPRVVVVRGELGRLDRVAELKPASLDGVLLANVLHYVADPAAALHQMTGLLTPRGRIVIVEYDRLAANRWVPYPVPVTRLTEIAAEAGLGKPEVTARRPSAYQGEMYCAALPYALT